jgi:hypothetical protein
MSFGNPHLSSDIEQLGGVDSGDDAGHTSRPEQNPAHVAGATDDFVSAEWLDTIDWSTAPIDLDFSLMDEFVQVDP